ncbi:phage antirepressor N-terminal domain-containing protein [Fusobacterium varium]|uniref:phage antirepressor N-terminal domain-containing protein n=1 Tax=Fusobacterium TaxID=848 RepID=UPI0030D55229
MNDLVVKEVNFNGATLVGILKEGKIYTPLRKICDFLGVDFSSQLQRIKRDETLVKGVCKIHIPSEGGIQETLTLEISFLPLWLTGIKSQQCREEIRRNLLSFKLEAKEVLASAFLGKRELETKEGIRKDWMIERMREDLDKAEEIETKIYKEIADNLLPIYERLGVAIDLKSGYCVRNFMESKKDRE